MDSYGLATQGLVYVLLRKEVLFREGADEKQLAIGLKKKKNSCNYKVQDIFFCIRVSLVLQDKKMMSIPGSKLQNTNFPRHAVISVRTATDRVGFVLK